MPALNGDCAAMLKALRRIIHATDLHAKHVVKQSGLTVPQVLILQAARDLGAVTTRVLSEHISLSPATVTTVLDRLEERALIVRYRSQEDRRIVHVRLTPAGSDALARAPALLHERFTGRFLTLPPSRRATLIAALAEVAAMMDAASVTAAEPDLVPEPDGID